MSVVAAGSAAIAIGGAIFKGIKAKNAREDAEERQAMMERQITAFENNRQDVINPYSDVTSLADLATDLSGGLSNSFANLGVATSAAEIEMEQTDIALANTLDALQATGASAGGATALAQAAARSKQGVAAGIEKQEANNEKLEAQGAQRLQEQQMAEKQRIQNIQLSEGGREQMANAQGRAFEFSAQENRDNMQLNRIAGQEAQARQDIATQDANMDAAISAGISGVSSGLQAVGSIANSNKQADLTRTNDEDIAKLYNN